MKLKFINLLLASVLLVGSAQVFTSCKDNEADFYVNLKEETISLADRLDQQKVTIEKLWKALDNEKAAREAQDKYLLSEIQKNQTRIVNLTNELAALREQMKQADNNLKAELDARIKNLQGQIDSLAEIVAQHTTALATIRTDIKNIYAAIAELNKLKDYIDGKISDLDSKYEGITNGIIERLEKLEAIDHDDMLQRIIALEEGLAAVQETLDGLNTKVGEIDETVQGLVESVEGLNGSVEEINATLETMTADVTELKEFMNTWKPLLPGIQEDATNALAKANSNKIEIDELRALIEQYKNDSALSDEALQALIDALTTQINETILPQLESLAANDATLLGLIESLREDVNNKLDAYATLEELAKATSELQAQAQANYDASIAYTLYMCAGIRAYIDSNFTEFNNKFSALNTSVSEIRDAINDLEIILSDKADKSEVTALRDDMNNAIDNVLEEINKTNVNVGRLFLYIDQLRQDHAADINALNSALASALEQVTKDITSLRGLYTTINTQVEKNTAAITALQAAFDTLSSRIEEVAGRINGVIIQQVDNPVFGTFNLPAGINSQMLLAWWGEVDGNGSEFPTAEAAFGYKTSDEYLGLTWDDLARIDMEPETVESGYVMNTNEDGKAVLGTVYMTVNPSNASLTGKNFSIVNSLGKATPLELNPVASNKELNFGYTRGGSDNGFYESEAAMAVNQNNIAALQLTFNANFKNTVAQIVKDGRKSINAGTIAKLGNALYDQINGVLPALAISVQWNDSESGAMQVNSNYGLAAATLHARNLALINAFDNSGKQIPDLPDFSGLIDRFNVWYDSLKDRAVVDLGTGDFKVNIGNITVTISAPQVSFAGINPEISANINEDVTANANLSVNVTVNVEGTDYPATGTATGEVTVPINTDATVDLSSLLNQMETAVNNALKDAMGNVGTNITNEINSQLATIANQIEKSVNDMLTAMSTNINSQIQSILNDLQSTINGKLQGLNNRLSGLIGSAQNFIDRLNMMLQEPSHYLQPVLLYNADSKVGILSTNYLVPSVFKANVPDAAITLIPTTYTLETIVPLYKKFVAVTNVWKNGEIGGATQSSVLADANAQGHMKEVLPANRHAIALKLQPGYTYEIAYQGMDFDGKVSGRKYYVTVK